MLLPSPSTLAFAWPLRLEFMSGWQAAGLFVLLSIPILLLGIKSLAGLGPVRKWVVIGVRLAVLLLFVLILAGARWQRQHKDLEVMVLRDVSRSTSLVSDIPPGKPLQESLDDYFRGIARDSRKKPDDRIGIISFKEHALVDAMPSRDLKLDTRGIPDPGTGTDASAAIQLALATLSPDTMHRIVLVWDGNQTEGDIDAAVAAAAAQHVPIDVVPLRYDVKNEVMVERFVAPTWQRENAPFTLDVVLRSTNAVPVTGQLSVLHKTEGGDEYLDMDLTTPKLDTYRTVTLKPGLNVEHVRVPALHSAGVHQFHASFSADNVTARVAGVPGGKADTLDSNNDADSFTFVRGKGQVLYVNNAADAQGQAPGAGETLIKALAGEGINCRQVTLDQIPQNVVALQNYDAVILANVPRGEGGMTSEQDQMLARYVHDMGGGVVMIGGEHAFGAGGWQGSEMEKVLPVDMDIPAQRQIGKGALVLVMHSCEMPDGNYWGVQCAMQAIKALSDRDEIGVISYGWNGGASQWDFPLQEKGDGGKVIAAVQHMQLGDMPSFDDSMNVALNGSAGQPGLMQSNARHKHVIIISDGDPGAPAGALMDQYKQAKVSVSTITVYPHSGGPNSARPPVMDDIPNALGGRAYGPINSKPSQLPQIFIKEATIVRRTLIYEPEGGIPVALLDASDEMIKGLSQPPPLLGMVLTSRKNDPKVVLPLASGKMNDPVLAHWQSGLGKSAIFAGDATNKWGADWVASSDYAKFWAQVVRSVSRPPMSSDFDVETTLNGDKGKVVVEALNRDDTYLSFLNIGGAVVGPDMKEHPIRLVQTGPGTYEGQFDTKAAGNYVVALNYKGQKGDGGMLLSGAAMNSEPEMRDLKSNDGRLQEIADRTGGRLLAPFDAQGADVFTREGVLAGGSPLPIWDILLSVLVGMILVDVAARRIAWDVKSLRRVAAAASVRVREFTTVRRVESRHTLDALKKVREEGAATPKPAPAAPGVATEGARPNPAAKFEAGPGVEGDISRVVGGASDKPLPPAPKKIEPKGIAPAGGHTGSLLEAKRRAQQAIKKKEEGE